MEELSFKILLLVIFVSSILPSHTRAHIADFDEHWKQRAEEAMKHVEEAYHHNPYDVTDHFDHNVTKAANRMRLGDCVLGFGAETTGGENDKAVDGEELKFIFKVGRVHFTVVKNIIIHGIHIHDIQKGNGGMIRDSVQHFGLRTESDGDGVSIFGSSNIWVDHLSMRNCYDGLVDAVMGSLAITVSSCNFRDHDEVTMRAYAPQSEWKNWLWTSEDDLLLNGAFFVEYGDLEKKGGFNERDSLVARHWKICGGAYTLLRCTSAVLKTPSVS
ncbi:hypothetical protein Dimus_023895 [Dionaea muscipula]